MSKADKTNVDDEENALDDTIPWSETPKDKDAPIGGTNSDSEEINTSDIETWPDIYSSDDNMDIDDSEDLTESNCVSNYIIKNPAITQQNKDFLEITFNQNTIIEASWRAASIHILPGCIVSCEDGGILYLAREGKLDLKIVGENSKYGASAVGEIIEG